MFRGLAGYLPKTCLIAGDRLEAIEQALGRIVGAVMKKSQGKANPTAVNRILKDLLK